MELDGRAAIVTGAGTGVERQTAIQLAEQGCSVLVNYSRSKAGAEETAAECERRGVKAIGVRADVSNNDDCRAMVAQADKAGILEKTPLKQVATPETVAAGILAILMGPDMTTGHVVPHEGGVTISI
jgi:shikimate 5-dehydrogenase